MTDKSTALLALTAIKNVIDASMIEIEARRYSILIKPDGSPVTEADIWVEALIESRLRETFPDIRFIGEESFEEKITNVLGLVAVVDPIDGTENFCSGMKEWGVSIGIWEDSRHLASLLMLPELGIHLLTGQKLKKVKSRITGFSSSYSDNLIDGIKSAVEYRVIGCAVFNIYSVIRGSFSQFINPKGARVWDLLPGLAIALEHGCEVYLNEKSYDGRLLDPTQRYRVDIRHGHDIHTG